MPGSISSKGQTPRSQTPDLRDSSRLPADNGMRENIKISVRIRPLSEKESSRGDRAVWGSDGTGGVGLLSAAGDKLDVKFAYDVVFDAGNTNEHVFDKVAWPAIEPVLQGVSGTVFAYGVTSSGKTHTMMGTPGDQGVVPRAIQALFARISSTEDCVYSVTLSMMEIYCEMLNDLLDSSKLNLDVQECQGAAGKGSVMVVKGLTEGKVASAAEALALIQQGQDNRKVASTAFNDQSSRSHTICRLLVESTPKRSTVSLHSAGVAASSDASSRRGSTTGQPGSCPAAGSSGSSACVSSTSAWLTLVDLAGSEGAKAALSKDQQAEARDINRSLLTLGKVMYELAKGGAPGHLPFRDSLLTRLLKASLTGSGAKVAIICNVTPASSQSDETWNTLRFADGAKRIKITAVKNEALDIAAVVAQYQREVAGLKAQLAALSGAAASGGGSLSMDVLQAFKETLDSSRQDNAADQLKDQAAQLQYIRECLSFAMHERDQLLIMNKKLTAMLVQQVKLAAPPVGPLAPGAAAAATAEAAPPAALYPTAGPTDTAVPNKAAGAAAEREADAEAAPGGGRMASPAEAPSGDSGLGPGADSSRCCWVHSAAGSCAINKARKRAARIRRCLSYESLQYYGQWMGGSCSTPGQQQQQQQAHPSGFDEPGLECNAADAAEVQQLLRITSDELPEYITHGRKQELKQQLEGHKQQQHRQGQQRQEQEQEQQCQPQDPKLQPEQQQQQLPDQQSGQETPAATAGTAAAAAGPPCMIDAVGKEQLAAAGTAASTAAGAAGAQAAAAAAGEEWQIPAGLPSSGQLIAGGLVSDSSTCSSAATAATVPCQLVQYFSAISSFGGHSGHSSEGNASSANGVVSGSATTPAVASAGAAAVPVLPCPIVFPGSRRTSKTLALAVPGHPASGGTPAGWLGCVGLPVVPEGLSHSALCEAVEAHKLLAAQEGRLELLLQQLADKEALLEQARQLQQGQVLQLRLTITAADRALLRDKLAEAEQQLASYKAQQVQYEQELQEIFEQAAQLYSESQQVAQERDALAAHLLAMEQAPGGAAAAAADSACRSISRCSSGCGSPEPVTRIPLPPGSPVKGATYGGSSSTLQPACSRVAGSGGSFSRSLGSPPRKSAAAAASFNSIRAAMATASLGSCSAPNSARGPSPVAGSMPSSLSPRLSKLAAVIPALTLDGIHTVQHSSHSSSSLLRPSHSTCSSPRSLSRSNSTLLRSGPAGVAGGHSGLGGISAVPGLASPAKDRDSKMRLSLSSSSDVHHSSVFGGFNPICLTSPFHEQALAAAAAELARDQRASADAASVRSSAAGDAGTSAAASRRSGCGSISSPRQSRGAADATRTGASMQGKQSQASRIPLPPFLKRHSKRLLQMQQQQSDGGEGSRSPTAPMMDKFLMGLHGQSILQTSEQLASCRVDENSRLKAGRSTIDQPESAGGQGQRSQPSISPFAAAAVAATAAASAAEGSAEAAADGAAKARPVGAADESLNTGGDCSMTGTESVKSHPLELPDSCVAGWSARTSEVFMP